MNVKDAKACLSFLDRPSLFKTFTKAEEAIIREARESVSAGIDLGVVLGAKLTSLVGRVAA